MTKRVLNYRFAGILPVIVGVIIGSSLTGVSGTFGKSPIVFTPVTSPISTPAVATPVANAPLHSNVTDATQELGSKIPKILANDTGVYGVVIVDPSGAIVYEHNADVPFISASLYKLPLMAQIYSMIEAGTVTLDQEIVLDEYFFPGWDEESDSYFSNDYMGMSTTVEEALFAAGAYSSNVGALALASLTTWIDIDSTAQSLGMTSTYLVIEPTALALWPPMPGTSDDEASLTQAVAFIELQAVDGPVMITTPRDVAMFFSALLAGNVVSADASTGITGILAQQMVDDRFPQLLPAGTELVHKTGNLEHIVLDAGAIYTSSGPVILAALSEDTSDDSIATWIIQELALTTFDIFSAPTS